MRTAVEVAGTGLGAVRLDSGDLVALAGEVRAQLDGLGATGTRIVVTSDLDEYAMAALAAAPVDAYGCGKDFEVVESMHHHAGAKKRRCPGCRSTKVERVLATVFAKTRKKS